MMLLALHSAVGAPRVSLSVSETATHMVFDCTSTVSPATSVIWLRDGTPIQKDRHHIMEQYLTDRGSSTYGNLLMIPVAMVLRGRYSCNVRNDLGVGMDHQEICKQLLIN